MKIENLVRKNIAALTPYSTARDEYQGEIGIYLDANENPYDNSYNRYPDPYQKRLKETIGKIKGVETERIFIGNGSDEAIDLCYRVFCEPSVDNVVSIAPTYGMYRVAAEINNVEFREVLLEEDYSLDSKKLLAATDSNTKLLFICSPNNPTANSFPLKQIEAIVAKFNGIVVVDEAYIEFSTQKSLLTLLGKYPNLVVLQTLSKAWGMAGLRLGLAFADSYIISLMTRVKYPYNINVVTQKIVYDQLQKNISTQLKEIIAQRDKLSDKLSKMAIIEHVYPSDANFVLVRVNNAKKLYNYLIGGGVIVRDRSKIKLCQGALRITIGTPMENQRLITLLEKYKNE